MRLCRPLSVMLSVLLLAAAPLLAQSDRGQITGTVTDTKGAVVPGAQITVTDLNTGEMRKTTSSGQGDFTVPQLKADPYRVVVEQQGFKTATVDNVQIAVQVTRTVNVSLEVGTVSEQVTVTGAAPVIQTESSVLCPGVPALISWKPKRLTTSS